ncbi:hypothetical protein DFH08DRAFT_859629 [Mycena albidolilacea]|uniref:Uncharacterized protein n=1 Tax=Mycena albidolilacea TaxID=1033008 RepID=A0AAD7A9K2_9AGAR|nr:hypothetical protein DFH08DRAFT_859629 [Mycena albidolilacea]
MPIIFGRRKSRTLPATKRSDSERKSGQQETPQKKSSLRTPETLRTASNVLDFALRTLGRITSGIPLGGALSGVVESLLEVTGRIEQTSVNAHGLGQLAARIERITPVVNDMARTNPVMGQKIVQELQRELASMTQDLKDARSKGKLNQFFNSADNASALERHNMALANLIADSTLVTVNEVLSSLREIERSKSQGSSSPEPPIVLGNVKGGFGGTGGFSRIGGEGGEGGGPRLEMDFNERYRIGNISGGAGGTGGEGIEVGGRGGTGKGPVISMLRRSRLLTAEPLAEEESSIW